MKINIEKAEMKVTDDIGYLGKVHFTVDQHKEPYEIVFHSKSGKDWGYSLHFLQNSGLEEEIEAVDQYLNDHDDAFQSLLRAALQAGNMTPEES